MGWGDIFGHASYIVLAISYLLTNIFWLRVAACIGIFLEIIYFAASGGNNLVTGIAWCIIFISINCWQLYFLVKDRWSFDLPHSDRWLLRRSFVGLDDAQLGRVARTGRWAEFDAGSPIATEGQPVDALAIIFNGVAAVQVAGKTVGHLHVGDLVGEVAFLTGSRASASVSAEQLVRVLAFERTKLAALCSHDDQVAKAVYHLIGRELAQKMVLSNAQKASDAQAPVAAIKAEA